MKCVITKIEGAEEPAVTYEMSEEEFKAIAEGFEKKMTWAFYEHCKSGGDPEGVYTVPWFNIEVQHVREGFNDGK